LAVFIDFKKAYMIGLTEANYGVAWEELHGLTGRWWSFIGQLTRNASVK